MDDDAKQRLIDTIVGAMQGVTREIQVRQLGHFMKADPAYDERIAKGLEIDPADIA